jgi:soluble lytic murein transglycosylase
VPLAFGAIGMEAMNQSLPVFAQKAIEMNHGSRSLPVFTTPKIREAFLNPEKVAMKMTLDVAKEEYFKSEVPFGAIIYREAIKNELPPELIAAVVESESDFQAGLVSNKDARGLMQIVPETARFMRCQDPFDPDANIAAGTGYLHYLINRFGDVQVALAAYNAGEGTVERLGGIPRYPETIEYVERVSRRTRFYRQGVQDRYTAAVQMASVIER